MKNLTKPKPKGEGIKIHGFYRVNLEENGKIVGDSGWQENTIVNEGFDDFLCRLLAGTTDSKQISFISLGTGTAPNVTHDTLDGEITNTDSSHTRKGITVTVSDSKTLELRATFLSANSHISAVQSLRNIGLHNSSNSASMFAGSTYATSSVNTNQNINVSYDIEFT